MQFVRTTALAKIQAMNNRLKIIQGGSSAGKTIAILLILIDRAQTQSLAPELISVVSETVPHLKRGAIRDFLNIMEGHNYFNDNNWNKTDFTYTFETGSKIEFFSADNHDRVRGPRRDILFINEANNLSYESFTQLEIRTNKDIYIDYNPVAEFWVHTDIIPNQEHDFTILTYKDNEGLPDTIVKALEAKKHNERFWQVYGLGQLGEVEGRIYKDWQIINSIPHEARLERRGLDFGYSNDPTAIVDVYKYNGGYIFDEVCYQIGLSNREIADILKAEDEKTGSKLVIADAAEPKSIDEIKKYGVQITSAQKGQGSVLQGIQYLQDQRVSVTKRSTNLIREYRNYMWQQDRNGKTINQPIDMFNHCMDAARYAFSLSTVNKTGGQVFFHRKF